MKITKQEIKNAIKQPSKSSRYTGGSKKDPNSHAAKARELGMNPSTWRNRLKAVEAGKMTLEEAKTKPIHSRRACGKLAAKKKRGDALRR